MAIVTLAELKEISVKQIERNKKLYTPDRLGNLLVEHGWIMDVESTYIGGLKNNINYKFVKILERPMLVKFGGKGYKWEGFYDLLLYKTGFTASNTSDIDKYTLQTHIEARVIDNCGYTLKKVGDHSSWSRGLSKAEYKSFKGVVDLSLLPVVPNPDGGDSEKYPIWIPELVDMYNEEKACGFKLSEERKKAQGIRKKEILVELKASFNSMK